VPLDLSALARQAEDAADHIEALQAERQRQILAAREERGRATGSPLAARVRARVARPGMAAIPLDEPRQVVRPPAEVSEYTVVSADGSHLDQDHHDAIRHWVINIGSARLTYGASPGAALGTVTRLGFRRGDLYRVMGGRRVRLQGQLLNVVRQVDEMDAVAGLCVRHPGALGLIDGTLVLSSPSRLLDEEPTELVALYLSHVERARSSRAIVASYISRPAAAEAVTALRIGACPERECDEACRFGEGGSRACGAFTDICDRDLWEDLAPGERSGLWRSLWPISDRYYGTHAVHFFYWNSGSEIARVEVPGWVAENQSALDRLVGVLRAQVRRGDQGYPRALIEAHHRAVITAQDRRSIESVLASALARSGNAAHTSAKETIKRLGGI